MESTDRLKLCCDMIKELRQMCINVLRLWKLKKRKSVICFFFFSGLDLAALNIQRGRDHGLPGYNLYRAICNLTRADNFNGLRREIAPPVIERLKRTYSHVDDVDLFTGNGLCYGIKALVASQFSGTCSIPRSRQKERAFFFAFL